MSGRTIFSMGAIKPFEIYIAPLGRGQKYAVGGSVSNERILQIFVGVVPACFV